MSESSPPALREPDSKEVLALVREGLDLVDVVARQMRRQLGPHVQLDDLVSQGREALLAAARSYDASRGVPFRRWANLRVRGAMVDGMRSQGGLPRRVYRQLRAMQAADHVQATLHEEQATAPTTAPEGADAKLGEYLSQAAMAMAVGFLGMKSGDALDHVSDDEMLLPEAQVARAELLSKVRAAIARLPDSERTLLERHYFEDATLEDAAKDLGLSKSWGSRLHARAIECVARDLKRSKIAG